MLIKKPSDIRSSEITDEQLYENRRAFIRTSSAALVGLAASTLLPGSLLSAPQENWKPTNPSRYDTTEDLTPFNDITTYNNFYEFGIDKDDPSKNSKNFKTKPWTVSIEGEVKKTGAFALDDLLKPYTMEDRIYRLRCVEAWSMVIPWYGFPLRDLIKRFDPTSQARYVEMTTLLDPQQMPGQRGSSLDWPYVEGLRMDEAMHPLTILAVGLYGKTLPSQNGAPLRLVVPWKYGFKSVKSIVRIRFVEKQPLTAWVKAAPKEYGFYSNVNPDVDHPRWSQSRERRIGEFFKRKTLPFNGYADQVAKLYAGMDLKANY